MLALARDSCDIIIYVRCREEILLLKYFFILPAALWQLNIKLKLTCFYFDLFSFFLYILAGKNLFSIWPVLKWPVFIYSLPAENNLFSRTRKRADARKRSRTLCGEKLGAYFASCCLGHINCSLENKTRYRRNLELLWAWRRRWALRGRVPGLWALPHNFFTNKRGA